MLSFRLPRFRTLRLPFSILALSLFSLTFGCSGGKSSSTDCGIPCETQTAPSNLVYPQTSVSAVMGQAITSNTPTVTGTVTSYSVRPALPAGLTLNTSTGVISGTPTAAVSATPYTITATNSAGSTTATVQIAVTVPPPSGLKYTNSIISATVGQAITSDGTTVSGPVTSYTVSPRLPAGLSLDATTGIISGTPTAASAQTTYVVTASNASGSTTASLQITVNPAAPSGLSYSPSTISAAVGQAIAADNPTVTGTVTSYAVAPALPAGLSLNATTGVISGTPTAVTAQATYVVTASNSTGSTTASLQITVTVAPPSALGYPQATITATVGKTIAPNLPSFTGTPTAFSVSPALPAGLTLDSGNGAIYGTPTTITAQASYTVTASNAGGSTTASLSIAVNKAYTTVLELGHGSKVTLMRSISGRLLSLDQNGHWALWDTAADSELASGDQYLRSSGLSLAVDMAGSIIVVGHQDGLEIRSSVDGHLVTFIVAPNAINPMVPSTKGTWWKLASDGSYICVGSSTGLVAFSPTGLLLSRSGDYSSANVFAAAGQIQVALGPAGQNVIETITVSSGASNVGPAFSGNFNSWFVDGQSFLTNAGTTVWEYSAAGVQQGFVSLPTVQNLTGLGNWIATCDTTSSPNTVSIYAVGASSPSATYTVGNTTIGLPFYPTSIVASGSTLGIITQGYAFGNVVDLSGSSPVKTDFTTSLFSLSAYSATGSAKWFAADQQGVIVDGSSPNASKTLDLGMERGMAGGTTRVAIATANGLITYLNPAMPSATSTIAFPGSKLALSSDDTVLAAANFVYSSHDRTLKIFSLPLGTTTATFPSVTSGPYLNDFSLSSGGSVIGREVLSTSSSTSYSRIVGPVSGGSPIWSDTNSGPIQISPDGTLIAATTNAPVITNDATNIYKNGVLVGAATGEVVGWLDNSSFLANTFSGNSVTGFGYAGAVVYDSSGATLSTPMTSIPRIDRMQALGGDQIYSPYYNTIYLLSTGQPVWTATVPSTDGAVAGSYVVFVSGSQVLLDTH